MDGNGRLMPSEQAEHVRKYANMWRISADFWDEWESLKKQFELCNKWSSVSGPRHWPDADMLPLGRLNRRGPNQGPEHLTNGEVLQVNQKSENNRQLFRDGDKIAWIADVPGSSDKYLALFYTSDLAVSEIAVNLREIGFNSPCKVRDLWNHLETGIISGVFRTSLPAHGSGLFKVSPI